MELVEREQFLDLLRGKLDIVATGEGQCVFIGGEPGMGKTAMVKAFCKAAKSSHKIYQGSCDALFTPRPLAPLYDVLWQAGSASLTTSAGMEERTELFAGFLNELMQEKKTVIIVFEDIHWADEATLDFIKFFARRITQLPCLFILTYRHNEIHPQHPLRNVLGQLSPDTFTKIQLPALSEQAVKKMADEKGYNGQEVYSISGGNPFYVTEILASYSPGIPENIKDSILAVYNAQDEKSREAWELLAVTPAGFDIKYLEKLPSFYSSTIEKHMAAALFFLNGSLIFFKHELYRRTIETSMSPLKRVLLNKKILDLLGENAEQPGEIERIIHHAKNANAYDLVVRFAPVAAKQAAQLGAHIEACKLYLSAIEYYQENDKDILVRLYEAYAYECYLTNKMKEAIIYTSRAMQIWKEKNNTEKTGNSLRFLSRLWWFEGNRKNAEQFATEAIEVLEPAPASAVKAMSFSNMSQLYMLSKEMEPAIFWGEKAIAMAEALHDEEILSHALNNVGTVMMKTTATNQKGMGLLQQSLDIALKNGYHEHAARAYTNQVSNSVVIKDYDFGKKALDEGIFFCEERDLDSWAAYMLSWKSRLLLETGNWSQAFTIAENLLKNETQPSVIKISVLSVMATLKMRKGDPGTLPLLLEANAKALDTMELQRIIPALAASLEYEWITGETIIAEATIDNTIAMMNAADNFFETNEFVFWLQKARGVSVAPDTLYEGYDISTEKKALKAAALWKQKGCRYEQALVLFEGNDANKKEALSIVQELGAAAVYEKMKMDMRSLGIKSIPRGARKTTLANPALLTDRELDILKLLQEGLQNKEIAARLYISAKTVDHHISSVLFKLEVNTRTKAVQEAIRLGILQ